MGVVFSLFIDIVGLIIPFFIISYIIKIYNKNRKKQQPKTEVKKNIDCECEESHNEISNEYSYCDYCGAKIKRTEKKCPHCKAKLTK